MAIPSTPTSSDSLKIDAGEKAHYDGNHMEQNNYATKKLAKQESQADRERKRSLQSAVKTFSFLGALAALAGLGIWYASSGPDAPQDDVVAKNGMHWHAKLAIFIDGKEQEIPNNIGIGITHNPMHTHDAAGEIHLEFSGLVKKDDTQLGKFFEVWGKKFSSSCILDSCAKDGKSVKMLVNGKQNDEFENYLMQDKDNIEIRLE